MMKRILLLLSALGLAQAFAQTQPAQAPPSQTQASPARERRGMNQPGENVIGKVTVISKDSLVIAPLTGGSPVTIKISETTRVMKERQPIKLDEIKVDEVVF